MSDLAHQVYWKGTRLTSCALTSGACLRNRKRRHQHLREEVACGDPEGSLGRRRIEVVGRFALQNRTTRSVLVQPENRETDQLGLLHAPERLLGL